MKLSTLRDDDCRSDSSKNPLFRIHDIPGLGARESIHRYALEELLGPVQDDADSWDLAFSNSARSSGKTMLYFEAQTKGPSRNDGRRAKLKRPTSDDEAQKDSTLAL